jgi:Tol biopolymer transport system component
VSLAAGSRLGPYEILAPIGAGGMGEVYRARDTRLHRDVALKVLPPALVADPSRRERFVQEARTASAFEHPYIAVIHEIGEFDGVTFIAMELVRGEALSHVIARGPLPATRALDLAIEVAEGLARAHDKGIVHRDLKPANVMVTEDGHAKIIDFGLAKLMDTLGSDPSDVTRMGHLTTAGVVLGTPSYMSPEQTHNATVDHRSDIFSFGIMLHEMLTGHAPFRGRTPVDTMHAILHDPPPTLPASIGPATGDLQRILDKCLAKDPAERYQGMRDLGVDLRSTRRRLDSSQLRAVRSDSARRGAFARRRPTARQLTYVSGVLAIIVVAAAGRVVWLRTARRTPADRAQWVQLTNMDVATQPALSPDGRMLAFIRGSSTFATEGQIWLKILPDGAAVPVTQDTLTKMGPVFSPDNERIAYTANGPGHRWETWIVPALHGEPRRWLANASGLTWIDRGRVLFSEIDIGEHMGIVTSTEDRSGSRAVYFPADERGMAHRSYLSPDGKWVLIVEMAASNGVWLPCRVAPFAGGSPSRSLGPPDAKCSSGAWSADGDLVYLSMDLGDGYHIWRQRLSGEDAEPVTSGPTEEEGVAIAPDGRSLITSVGFRQRTAWIHDRAGERQLSLEGYAYWPLLSADGRTACYRVKRTAGTGQSLSELWMTDLASGRSDRLLPGRMITTFDVSRDGRVVAAVPDEEGRSRLWLAWLDAHEPPRRLADIEGDVPRFAGDKDIVFRTAEGNRHPLTRVHEDGTGQTAVAPSVHYVLGNSSPDGRWVSIFEPPSSLRLYSSEGGPTIPILSPAAVSRIRWSRDGSRLYLSLQLGETSAFGAGKTYVIPLSNGALLPPMPSGGFHSEEELAAIPGVTILPYGDVAPGPTSDVYVFSRTTTTRNLYRIPVS